jgi:hypothetical protein
MRITTLLGLLMCIIGCSDGNTTPTNQQTIPETIPSGALADHYRENPNNSPRTGKRLRVTVGTGVIRINGDYVYRWPGGRRPSLVFRLTPGTPPPPPTATGTFTGQCIGLDATGAGAVPGPAVVIVDCVFTPAP